MNRLKHSVQKPFEPVNWAKYRERSEVRINQLDGRTGKMQRKICLGYDPEMPMLDLGTFADRHLIREIQRIVRTNPDITFNANSTGTNDPAYNLIETVLYFAYDIKEGRLAAKPTDADFEHALLTCGRELRTSVNRANALLRRAGQNKEFVAWARGEADKIVHAVKVEKN